MNTCKDYKYWCGNDAGVDPEYKGGSLCIKLSQLFIEDIKEAIAGAWHHSHPLADFITKADFGCNQFEAKEERGDG